MSGESEMDVRECSNNNGDNNFSENMVQDCVGDFHRNFSADFPQGYDGDINRQSLDELIAHSEQYLR